MPKRRKQFEVSIINRLGGTPTAHKLASLWNMERVGWAPERLNERERPRPRVMFSHRVCCRKHLWWRVIAPVEEKSEAHGV